MPHIPLVACRCLGWSAFALLLAGLACGLDALLPPEPRWSLEGQQCIDMLAGASLVTYSEKKPRQLVLRDLATGTPRFTLVADANEMHPWTFSPDHRWLAITLNRRQVRLFDLRDGSERRLPVETAAVKTLVFSPDAKLLAVEVDEKKVLLLEVATGVILLEVEHAYNLYPDRAFTHDNAYFLCPPDERPRPSDWVKAWDLRQRRWAFALEGAEWLSCASPDGKAVFGAGRPDSSAIEFWLWDLAGQRRQRLELSELAIHTHHSNFSPDGRLLALWTEDAKKAANIYQLREVPSGRLLQEMRSQPEFRVWPRFSPDGRYLAGIAHDMDSVPPTRWDIHVYEAATGRFLWSRPWRRQDDGLPGPARLIFSADTRSLVTFGTAAGSVDFLDPATGALQVTVPLRGAPDGSAHWHNETTPDGRHYILAAYPEPAEPTPMMEWLHSWLPGWQGNHLKQTWVVNLRRRCVVGALAVRAEEFVERSEEWLSTDGRTLVTHDTWVRGARRIDCWDLPPARPWRWILGPPLALGLLVLFGRVLLRGRRRAVGVPGVGPTGQVL
jgi:WD40 repeat protein